MILPALNVIDRACAEAITITTRRIYKTLIELLQYLSPLGWEHINLTGDYVWRQNKASEAGQFRQLRLSKMLK